MSSSRGIHRLLAALAFGSAALAIVFGIVALAQRDNESKNAWIGAAATFGTAAIALTATWLLQIVARRNEDRSTDSSRVGELSAAFREQLTLYQSMRKRIVELLSVVQAPSAAPHTRAAAEEELQRSLEAAIPLVDGLVSTQGTIKLTGESALLDASTRIVEHLRSANPGMADVPKEAVDRFDAAAAKYIEVR